MDLKSFMNKYKIFVDTCTFMHESSNTFFDDLLDALLETGNKIIIPVRVSDEINKLVKSPNLKTRTSAFHGKMILERYRQKDCLSEKQDENDPFADNVFLYVFLKHRTRYNLALITQDRKLAEDISEIKKAKSVISSKEILTLKLDRHGKLVKWHFTKDLANDSNEEIPSLNMVNNEVLSNRQPDPSFAGNIKPQKNLKTHAGSVAKNISTDSNKLKADSPDYSSSGNAEGEISIVHLKNQKKVKLIERIGDGGEGKIYLTETGHACKIFKNDKLTKERFDKLTLMTDLRIQIPGLCWPLEMAYDDEQDPIGYIMPLAQGQSMQKAMFIKKRLESNFPNWTRRNLVQLAITWLEKVVELHKHDILIGDVNPHNFLVAGERDIYFVDTDSYQIGQYPCTVGMANFTAPEIQNRNFREFLRTPNNEYFAIATLLFMILLPGKPPYSHQGGGDPRENILNGEFAYAFGERASQGAPAGPWRFIWSHLPYKVKKAFYECFAENKRISAADWLDLMCGYKYDLEHFHLDTEGGSDELFPKRFKALTAHAKQAFGISDVSFNKKPDVDIRDLIITSPSNIKSNRPKDDVAKKKYLSVLALYGDLFRIKPSIRKQGGK